MSISSNIIERPDITTLPIKVKYTSSFTSASLSSYGITIHMGSNGPTGITGSVPQSTLIYRTALQLYYQQYLTGSLLFSTSSWDSSLQSTAASGSGDYDNRYFPTESNAKIAFVTIPRTVFGENISRHTFSVSSSEFILVDDGNGNIVDSNVKFYPNVGNILYAQGVCVITSQDYINYITSSTAVWSLTSEYTIYQNEIRCHVNENDFNYTLNKSTLDYRGYYSGSYQVFATTSDFTPYATTIGLYNDNNELLVVGKLSTPYPIPSNTDVTFVVRYDS